MKDLYSCIRRLPGWEDAVREPLEGGRSRAWRLIAGTRSAVLKVDREPRHAPINTRAEEADAQARASANGLAGTVYWHSSEGILTQWIEGRALTPDDLTTLQLEGIGAALRRLHALPLAGREYDFAAWANHYRESLEESDRFTISLGTAFEMVRNFNPRGTRVFSHNDLVPANIVTGNDGILFIDFEYAGNNSPLFDLATLIAEGQFGNDARSVLTQAYFGSDETPDAEIDELITIYRAMTSLWEASRSPAIA